MPGRRLFDLVLVAALAVFGMSLAVDEIEADQRYAGEQPGGQSRPRLGRAGGRTPGKPERQPGADAQTPSEIPAKGWWQIGKRVAGRFSDDRVMAEAAGVTFYTLLAIFPAIASLISIYGLIANPSTIGSHLSLAAGVIPEGGMQIITEQVKSLTSQPPKALGFGLIIGIATSLWSANAGIKALFDTLNVVYEVKETRSYVRRTLVSFAFTIGGLVFVVLALGAVVVVPAVLNFVGVGSGADTLLSLARWPLMLVAIAVMLAFIYRFGPCREVARWRWLTWGSGFAALVWVAASAGFSWYVANFGSYNKTYGSLGAAIGFMTWIWISTMVVLAGAEMDAAMEKQTGRDPAAGGVKARHLGSSAAAAG